MRKKSVLVIEDSRYLAEALADILNIKNHTATVALSGKEGLDLALKEHPDLIMLDIRLPDIDGYEVYKKIRNDDWGKNAKILVLTASESISCISKNINLPEENILFKPDWSVPDLVKKIDSVLDN